MYLYRIHTGIAGLDDVAFWQHHYGFHIRSTITKLILLLSVLQNPSTENEMEWLGHHKTWELVINDA